MVVWLDLLVSRPRKFSQRAQGGCTVLALSYVFWTLLCREVGRDVWTV